MLKMSVRVEGLAVAQRHIGKASPKKNPGPIERALVRAALRVQEIATKEMIRSSGGKAVRGVLTSRTRRLRRSIRLNRAPLPRAIEVGSTELYGLLHEFGLGRFPKRPFLGPALKRAAKDMERIFSQEIGKELRL